MRISTFSSFLFCAIVSVAALQSCKDDSYLTAAPPVPNQSFTEEFDTVSSAISRGWRVINKSEPIGPNVWQQGGDVNPWFPAFSNTGTNVGFIGADYNSTSAGAGIISNWLVSPSVIMQNGDKIVFHTRAYLDDLTPFGFPGDSTDWSNRLQVRININNDGVNVGSGSSVGDFDIALLDINPTYIEYRKNPALYSPEAFPARWTRYEATVIGLTKPMRGRFAFRYFVEGGGNNGLGSGVGVDRVVYTSAN